MESVGYEDSFTFEHDTGPDDANHHYHRIFILDDRTGAGGRELQGLALPAVAPTMLRLMDVPVPADMPGQPIVEGQT